MLPLLVMVKTSMFKRYANMATRAWRIPQLIRNIYTTRVSAFWKKYYSSSATPR